jgi:hypothetical protein
MENKDELVQQEIDGQVFCRDPLPNRSRILTWLQYTHSSLWSGENAIRFFADCQVGARKNNDDRLSPPLLPPLHQSLAPSPSPSLSFSLSFLPCLFLLLLSFPSAQRMCVPCDAPPTPQATWRRSALHKHANKQKREIPTRSRPRTEAAHPMVKLADASDQGGVEGDRHKDGGYSASSRHIKGRGGGVDQDAGKCSQAAP